MKASEVLTELQKLVASGHGDKHLYIDDFMVLNEIHVISDINIGDVGIVLETESDTKEGLSNEM